MRVAVTGANGQLGDAMVEAITQSGHTPLSLTRAELNLEDHDVEDRVAALDVDWIAHCAAYTAVDQAEQEQDLARTINVHGSAAVARGAARSGARLLYVSTDYVFDGTARTPYREDSAAHPINVYGQSKRAGEEAVAAVLERPLVVRTSWLMGGHSTNFARTMLRLGRTKSELAIVSDQVGRPTWVFDLAPALVNLMSQDAEGLLHVANEGQATWYEVAERLFSAARDQGVELGSLNLRETTTQAYGAPARRPLYSVLDLTRARERYGVTLTDWRAGLARAVENCP